MRAVLRNAAFRRLWISQVVLAVGDGVMQMGLLELFRAHGFNERVETAKLFFAVALPGLLLGPVAIALLDRWQRRHVLMVSDALRAVIVVVIAAWLMPLVTGRIEERGLFLVYSMIFVIGAVTTFYYPARYALIPNLVGGEKLIQANTLFTTSLAVAGVGSRALGGFVAERLGVDWAVLSNALAYVVSVGLIWNMRMEPHATTAGMLDMPPQGRWGELKTGLVYLWEHHSALPLTILSALFAFVGGIFMVAIVGYAMDTLGLRTGGLGYLVAAAGAGAAIGIGVTGHAGRWTRAEWLPFAQLTILGAGLVLLGLTTNVWAAAALLVVLGATGATVLIPIDAKLQEQVEDQRRGAVFAARGMLTSTTMVVAFWLNFGSDLFRRTPAPVILLWLGAGTIAVAGLLSVFGLRSRPAKT